MKRVLIGLVLLSLWGNANSQGYPGKPIRFVVGFGAGGPTDVIARVMAADMTQTMGQSVIVENKPGANGTIASDFVAKSAPDGYTLVMGGSSTHSSPPSLFKSLPYEPVTDFSMVGNTVETRFVLVVRADHPAQSLADLNAQLKAKGDKRTFGYGSATTQIAGAALMKRLGLTATPIPY